MARNMGLIDDSDVPLEPIDEKTKAVPERRIKNAAKGREIHVALTRADQPRNFYRMRHQALLDGEPPFDHAVLVKNGQASTTNVNWGDAKHIMGGVMAGVIDMNVSVERLLRAPINKRAVPDDEQRFEWENILSEELTRAIRGWEDYDRAYQTLGHHTFGHGVGIAYFEDAWDWRFLTTGLGDFVVPNGTEASEGKLEVASCVRYVPVHTLYKCIRNEAAAEKMGWNVKAVKKAIVEASPETKGQGLAGWTKAQETLRNNDLGTGLSGKTSKVGVFHQWVQEFSGKVTKYIGTLNPLGDEKDEEEPWLYERPDVYEEMRRGMVFFTYGIGDNGTLHSISGILRAIFAQATALNRTQCTLLDAAVVGAGIIMQPGTEPHLSRMKLIRMGGGMTVLPAAEHGEMVIRPMPDFSGGLMPLVADFRNTMGQRAGQFQGDSSLQQAVEKTRTQVLVEMEALGKVGATQINLWYPPWTRLLRECSRRICRDNYSASSPGGKEAVELRRRLKERGFPMELLKEVDFDSITAERAIGAGSGSARAGKLSQLQEISGNFDDIGQYNLDRDIAAAILDGNYALADRYKPSRPGTRPPMDTQIADLENALMKLGQEPVMQVNQLPMAHLDSHVPFLVGMVESIERGEAQMNELVEQMVIAHAHCTDHLEQVQESPTTQQKAAQYRQVLQQLGEVVGNAMRQAIAEQQKAMEQEGAEGGQGGPSPALQEKIIASRMKLDEMVTQARLKEQFKERDAQQKLAHKEQAFQQSMAHKDAATAASMVARTRERAEQAKVATEKAREAMKIASLKRGNPRDKDKSK